jgi:CDP-glucose 4,6-dehydratase
MEMLVEQLKKLSGKKVLVTGNTGFKGSWLCMYLHFLGAEVYGIALPAEDHGSLWNDFESRNYTKKNYYIDINDRDALSHSIQEIQPEIVFHLAAQAIVAKGYSSPAETYQTNIIGLVNLYDALLQSNSVQVIVNVTSDKCYENKEWLWSYRENDELGGYDPYSTSKTCAEMISASYRKSFFEQRGIMLATARAGNVIGGGDWGQSRLLPDLARAFCANKTAVIRNPNSIRPWQHVLEPLTGYLLLAIKLLEGGKKFSSAFNFGPNTESSCSVKDLVDLFQKAWSKETNVSIEINEQQIHEAGILLLDSSKAKKYLDWQPRWTLENAVMHTANWYENFLHGDSMHQLCEEQLLSYLSIKGSYHG